MLTVAGREYLVLTFLLLIFVVLLIPSLLTTRAEIRDGLRKQDIATLKHNAEMYFNEHNIYPTSLDASPYRYVVTKTQDQAASGYYIEAELEVEQLDQTAFDEDELRKYHFRILHEDNKILYRVCGGEETQCTNQP